MNSELKKILSQTLGIPEAEIQNQASMETLPQWDSVAHINVILSLEAQYGISFQPDEVLELNSIENIRRILMARGVPL
jgi:acyl carrier protein